MAAFSYQCHPFLVDSPFFFPNNNTPIKPSPSLFMDHHQPLLPPSQTLQDTPFSVTNYHETSHVGQTSKITISDNEPSSVTKNQSPEASMVVDKLETGEQVTQKMITPVQRKKRNRNGSSLNSPKSNKDTMEGKNKKQKKNNGAGGVKEEGKGKAEKKSAEEPPTGYIHVRARRGQATDSHSLAERVRREKISERMKMLQKLVPGCDKVTGKALMLDEIINYVQSLQNQVEFLSMKLASVNPIFYDFTMDPDTLMVRPEKLNSNSLAPVPPSLLQCSPNQATNFVDTTTVTAAAAAAAVNAAPSFPRANDYLLDNSTSYLLHGQRPNLFSEDNTSQFWDVEDQRQKLLNPYGFSSNLCSFH